MSTEQFFEQVLSVRMTEDNITVIPLITLRLDIFNSFTYDYLARRDIRAHRLSAV